MNLTSGIRALLVAVPAVLVLCLAADSRGAFGSGYVLEAVHDTFGGEVDAIDPSVSINNVGAVALIATPSGGSVGHIFVQRRGKEVQDISPSLTGDELGPSLQMNDHLAVLVRRKFSQVVGGILQTFSDLERWDALNGTRVILATGNPLGQGHFKGVRVRRTA